MSFCWELPRENFKPWGHPQNVRDPLLGINTSNDGFGNANGYETQFLMGDGSVRAMNERIDHRVLKALSTPDPDPEVAD